MDPISALSSAPTSTTHLISDAMPQQPRSKEPTSPPTMTDDKPLARYQDIELGRPSRRQQDDSDDASRDAERRRVDRVEKNVDIPDTDAHVVVLPWKRRDGWAGWMGDTVTADSLVWSLIFQAFSTGLLDATTTLDFNTFASNQTGNTILLTVAIVRLSRHQLLLTGVSLASFLGGALVFGHLGHLFGLRRRAWLLANVLFQIVCLILAGIFLSPSGPPLARLGSKHEWCIIMLFAAMSGAQVAAARQASVAEIPTAPMTSSYVDLVSDKYLFYGFTHEKAGARNRRLGYVFAMIAGSFIGAVMHKYTASWIVVVIALGFKLVVMGMMAMAPMDPRKEKR
ncbi:hypothetical protein L202_00119 [Cryptococcus amylolentus CBS 6039]|uniref:DUF1275 domain protein n=1 Tax=Cryptococcus amylolentus CBS 6039 TaxID=1295533 RepID=A0A1E3I8D9_9TREE|nr:hypothetical protein L202_00119 [Cryptococcus amylolentus CBS 6039]ODN84106.1 hypothetical protein L202_00119 [Cryptococcus amylolentus CBS 6039]